MWYNPIVYTTVPPLSNSELLWAIYQHFVATTSLFFALVICYFAFKTLVWLLPNFWRKGKE